MTRLKALSVLQTRDYVRTTYGEDVAERIKSELGAEAVRELYEAPLVATDWISVQTAVGYLMTFDRIVGKGDGSTAEELIRRGAAMAFSGIYRALFASTTPRTTVEKSARIWSRFYDCGEQVVEAEDNFARITIRGCPDMPKHHELLIVPYGAELLRCAGAIDVESKHVQCVADGAPECVTEHRWK